jgi:hypothetical protein
MLGISDAIELTKKIGELVRAGAVLELQETIAELREALSNAQDEVLALRAEVRAFKLKELEKLLWEGTAAKFPLVKAPGGGLVRRTEGPPEFYACPKCFEDQKTYPLQPSNAATGYHACPGCGKSFPVDPPKPLQNV